MYGGNLGIVWQGVCRGVPRAPREFQRIHSLKKGVRGTPNGCNKYSILYFTKIVSQFL
jgi:hypothetical protein